MAHTVQKSKTEMGPQTPVLENIRPVQPYLSIARRTMSTLALPP